jgi:hypothetical protein
MPNLDVNICRSVIGRFARFGYSNKFEDLLPGIFGMLCTMACWLVLQPGKANSQILNYDSRTEPAPHSFDWNDHYDTVQIHDDDFFEFNGGFASNLNLYETASGIVYQGVLNYIQTQDRSSLKVFNVNSVYIRASGESLIDLYNTTLSGDAQAGDSAQLRIHGGTFSRIYTWWSGGRIELDGNPIAGEVTACSGGIVRQNGANISSLSCAYGGLAILDQGTVNDFMTASYDSTLVIAGGVPPGENLRLFDSARVLVFHSGAVLHGMTVNDKRRKLVLADFDGTGINNNFAGIQSFLMLDGYGRSVVFSAWKNAGEEWSGSVELIRIDDELHLEILPNSGAALLAYRAPGTEVVQAEYSDDLISWIPIGEAIVGDWNIHTQVSRLGSERARYFRLRKWLKP